MGRQVNFYMLPEDQLEFENWLKGRDDVCFIKQPLKNQEIETIPTLVIPEMGKTWLGIYLARPTDLQRITLQRIPSQGYWLIDRPLSPVVEFDRCYYDGEIIRIGRLYFQPGLYEDKAEEKQYVDWADSLLKWIRRHYHKKSNSFEYMGPHAKKWAEEGNGQLTVR